MGDPAWFEAGRRPSAPEALTDATVAPVTSTQRTQNNPSHETLIDIHPATPHTQAATASTDQTNTSAAGAAASVPNDLITNPLADHLVPLPLMLDTMAAQIQALEDRISLQQATWLSALLDSPDKKELLATACLGLSAACNAAAGQVKAWAENLRATKSTLTIADTAAQLLDPATFASIRSPSDFAELWSEMGHAFKGVLAQLTPSTSGAQSSALVAVDYFLSAGDVFQDLILMRLDTMSLPALKMAAMQSVKSSDASPLQQAQDSLQALKDTVQLYAAMNWRYYRGLNGYGALLTLLTFLTALGTTAVGAQSTRSGSNQWLAYAVAALGGLHTLLVLVETRYSPKSLAKPFMIAHQQYTRLYKDIGDPKQDMPAPAGTPIDPTLTSATAHTDAPPVALPPALDATARAKARLDAFQAVFERLRTHCPYVYLHEDGSDTVETKRICRCLDIGAFFGLLEPIFTKIEKDTPSMQNLSLSRT